MNWLDIVNKIIAFVSKRKEIQPVAQPAPVVVPKNYDGFEGTELELDRKTYTKLSTSGELSIDGVFECYVIECPKESYEGSNVCIPAGTYMVKLFDSPAHGPNTPELQDVPGRTHIQMHPSNWAINPETKKVYLLGCIAPGTSKDADVVYSSKIAMAAIMSKIDWTKPVRIVVSD